MVHGLALASVVSQVGCVTVTVVLGALLVGLALDRYFDTRPLFTMVLLLGSIPVSMYLLVRIALSAVAHLSTPPQKAAGPEGAPEDVTTDGAPDKEE